MLPLKNLELAYAFLETILPIGARVDGQNLEQHMSEYDANQIQQITASTLVLHARNDTLVAYDQGEYTANMIPGAQLISMEKGGHLALMFDVNAGALANLRGYRSTQSLKIRSNNCPRNGLHITIVCLYEVVAARQPHINKLSKKRRSKMKKLFLVTLLLAAHFSLTAIVPLQPGDPQPPWWVGGRLIWPFAVDTRTLIQGDLLNTFTPLLAVTSAIAFLLAATSLLRRIGPSSWWSWLITGGAVLAILLQVIWFTGWAILPMLVNAALLWAIYRRGFTVERLLA